MTWEHLAKGLTFLFDALITATYSRCVFFCPLFAPTDLFRTIFALFTPIASSRFLNHKLGAPLSYGLLMNAPKLWRLPVAHCEHFTIRSSLFINDEMFADYRCVWSRDSTVSSAKVSSACSIQIFNRRLAAASDSGRSGAVCNKVTREEFSRSRIQKRWKMLVK